MNPSHPAVKRIGQEARSIQEDPSDFFLAQPLETDLFDWHFTILGPDESAFAGGLCVSFLSLKFCLLHLVSQLHYIIFGAVAFDLLVHSHFSRATELTRVQLGITAASSCPTNILTNPLNFCSALTMADLKWVKKSASVFRNTIPKNGRLHGECAQHSLQFAHS